MVRVLASLFLSMGLLVTAAYLSVPVAHAAPKPRVEVCHLPPGNSDNFHTITVNANALPAHLAHGDIEGACANAGEILCEDGDFCTVDAFKDSTEICLMDEPVDCDDGDPETRDSCDSAQGCVYEPVVVEVPEVSAQSQNVTLQTDENDVTLPVTITLVGNLVGIQSGETLNFTTTQGANGSVSSPVNVNPDDVKLCAISGGSCRTDAGCPGGSGDICELTTPASESATVVYTPNVPVTDDSFNFTVVFGGSSAIATVTIFDIGDEGSTTPPEVSEIKAIDLEVSILVGDTEDITIRGDAPGNVGDLLFETTTQPGEGNLTALVPNTPAAGSVRTATVSYEHTGSEPVTDTFQFRVCEVAAPTNCSVNIATVTVEISNPGELANDRTIQGNIDQPVTFDLAPSQ